MDISFVIVNWNTKDYVIKCLRSIFQTVRGLSFDVWLVDNASSDGSVEAVKDRFPQVHVIENALNMGFSAANNQAFRKMTGRYALLLNSDAELTMGAVTELFRFMEENRDAAIACGQLLNPDGSRQNSIANFPSLWSLMANETLLQIAFPLKYPGKRRRYTAPVEVESGIGACLLVRKTAMDAVGYLDEAYFFFLEETDWAYRMKKNGWKVYFVPTARIFHAQGKSVGQNVKARMLFYHSRYLYFKKWHRNLFPLIRLTVFSRLLVNTQLTFLGVVFCAGLNRGLNRKLDTYARLIRWHRNGCPKP
ncbi:MAG: glycosyltransferase family 2 protein [Desulfobacterales bacterium]|nr:glycosyltransferase family 2 protein [Desulfobacterales bacterium]MDD4071188.1 glycosyltransferase family 2 protein [Desulfobacterales bacterium]MDD4392196.1 glycosyltransferase family 2 protein [Desulfobacterales bacterium]